MRRTRVATIARTAMLLTATVSAACSPTERLVSAAEEGDVARLERLLDRDPSLVHAVDAEGRPLLHVAITAGAHDAALLLIDRGADVGARDPQGRSALERALGQGLGGIAALLIERGAPVDASITHATLRDGLIDADPSLRKRVGLDKHDGIWVGETSEGFPFGFEVRGEEIILGWIGLRAYPVGVPDYLYGSVIELTLEWTEGSSRPYVGEDGTFSASVSGQAMSFSEIGVSLSLEGAVTGDSLAAGKYSGTVEGDELSAVWTAHRRGGPLPLPVVEVAADPRFVAVVEGWDHAALYTSVEDPVTALSDLLDFFEVCAGDEAGDEGLEFVRAAGDPEAGVHTCERWEALDGIHGLVIADDSWLPYLQGVGARVRLRPVPGEVPRIEPPEWDEDSVDPDPPGRDAQAALPRRRPGMDGAHLPG